MRRVPFLLACVALTMPAGASAQQVVAPPTGRYQLVVVPGHPAGPFLVDTATGCMWQAVQDQEGKRTAFVEAEVQNLHWNLASQAVLSQRIDASTELNADQKRAVKQELERTRCGAFSVLMVPAPAQGAAPGTGQPGETKAPAAPPTKAPAPTKR